MVSVGLSYWRVDGCVESAEAPFFIDGTVLDLQSPLLLKKSTTIEVAQVRRCCRAGLRRP